MLCYEFSPLTSLSDWLDFTEYRALTGINQLTLTNLDASCVVQCVLIDGGRESDWNAGLAIDNLDD